MVTKYSFIVCIVVITACTQHVIKETSVTSSSNTNETITTSKINNEIISVLKTKWEKEYITASGQAPVVKKYDEEARNKMLARQGAITDAKRNLAVKINSTSITATTTMNDFSTSDFVQSSVKAVLQDVEIISERFDAVNGIYEVQIQMPKLKLLSILESYNKY